MLGLVALVGSLALCRAAGEHGCSAFSGCFKAPEECPSYEVVGQSSEYQLRRYTPSDWTSTCGGRESFRRLFRFISGDNEQSAKVPMTAPVVRTRNGPADCPEKMSFFAAPPFQGDSLPTPSEEGVFNELAVDLGLVAVRCYNTSGRGWGRRAELQDRHTDALREALDAEGVELAGDTEFWLGYNGPRSVVKHYEVMFQVQEQN